MEWLIVVVSSVICGMFGYYSGIRYERFSRSRYFGHFVQEVIVILKAEEEGRVDDLPEAIQTRIDVLSKMLNV